MSEMEVDCRKPRTMGDARGWAAENFDRFMALPPFPVADSEANLL